MGDNCMTDREWTKLQQQKSKTYGIFRNIVLKLLKVIPLNFHQKKLDTWKNAGKVSNVGVLNQYY